MKNFLLFFFMCCMAATTPTMTNADCASIADEIQAADALWGKNTQLLDANQKALNRLSATDTAKRIKISSNIMILTARLETGQNTKILKAQECKKQGCPACPTI